MAGSAQYKKKVGLNLSYRDDQGALSSGHELADCITCKLAAGFGKVELERRIREGDLDQRGQNLCIL